MAFSASLPPAELIVSVVVQMSAHVCVSVHTCMCMCVSACVYVCARAHMCVCVGFYLDVITHLNHPLQMCARQRFDFLRTTKSNDTEDYNYDGILRVKRRKIACILFLTAVCHQRARHFLVFSFSCLCAVGSQVKRTK